MNITALFGKKSPKERSDLYLRHVGTGARFDHELGCCSTQKVEWVSVETDENGKPVVIREPHEYTRHYSKHRPFSLAGKNYLDINHFLKTQDGEWAEDIYGRPVLCTKERYPCFDSYDYLYEDRYYRWFFIREGNSVSQLFAADDRDRIYVTENVRNIEDWAWGRMKATGFCQPPK